MIGDRDSRAASFNLRRPRRLATNPAKGAQDAALQERRLGAEIPLESCRRLQHLQRPTPSHAGCSEAAPGRSRTASPLAICVLSPRDERRKIIRPRARRAPAAMIDARRGIERNSRTPAPVDGVIVWDRSVALRAGAFARDREDGALAVFASSCCQAINSPSRPCRHPCPRRASPEHLSSVCP